MDNILADIAHYLFQGGIMKIGGEIVQSLWNKFWEKIKDIPNVDKALSKAKETKSEEVFKEKMLPYIQIAMEDEDFANEIKELVKKIKSEGYINITGDQNNTGLINSESLKDINQSTITIDKSIKK